MKTENTKCSCRSIDDIHSPACAITRSRRTVIRIPKREWAAIMDMAVISAVARYADGMSQIQSIAESVVSNPGCELNVVQLVQKMADALVKSKTDSAEYKFQRDSLLEMTWLDLPSDPTESTAKWRAMFEQGWERKAGNDD